MACPLPRRGHSSSPWGLPGMLGSHTEGSTVRGGRGISLPLSWGPPPAHPTSPPPNWLLGIPFHESSTAVLLAGAGNHPAGLESAFSLTWGPLYTTPPVRWCEGPAPLLERKDTREAEAEASPPSTLRREHLTCPECSPFSLPMDIPHSAVSCVHTLCVSQSPAASNPPQQQHTETLCGF